MNEVLGSFNYDILDLIATGLTFISVSIAAATLINDHKRSKKQATFEFYDRFKESVKDIENKIHALTNDEVNQIVEKHKSGQEDEWWNITKQYLSSMERFAVGINSGAFDHKLVDRMSGLFLYEQYRKLYPIIKYKREKDGNSRIYEEFKMMVNAIVKIRNKKQKFEFVD